MVLSNKKLKQKLKAALAESVADSVSGSNPIRQSVPNLDSSLNAESLKQLLDSATQKSRMSKREKRRKLRSSGASGDSSEKQTEAGSERNGEKGSDGAMGDSERQEKRKKKRKIGQETEESGGGGGGGDGEVKKTKKKKNTKNKKKKKWGKKDEKAEKTEAKNEEENKIAAADSQVNANDARKVYVGGIPYYSTEDDIRSYFESCGTITEMDCMIFPESGKFRGIAIITFKTEEAAKRALALDGADMGGLFLKIQPYKGTTRGNKPSNFAPPVLEGYNRIYIGNLAWDITEDDLRKVLSGCNVSAIRFGMDKETGEFRGYAHVDFSDSMSMNMAMKLDQRILCGRPIKVTSAIPKKNIKLQLSTTEDTAVASTTDTTAVVVDTVAVDDAVASSNNSEPSVSGGKMRRRTCYVCGEKGHISSACPKNPADDPANSAAT